MKTAQLLHIMQHNYTKAFIAGMALFAMFFGSGNLIFPIAIGVESLNLYNFAGIGLMITGVIIPMLGLISVLNTTHTDLLEYFKDLSKPVAWLVAFSIICLIGPLGVIPRSLMVATGGMELIFPKIPFAVMSGFTILLTGLIVYKQHNITEVVGKWLTPFLLLGILCIIIWGAMHAPDVTATGLTQLSAFNLGFFQGYQTMDLLAALFFSLIIAGYLEEKIGTSKDNNEFLKLTAITCIVCGAILALVYGSFLFLGSHYSIMLQSVSPPQFLEKLAVTTLGNFALPIASLTIYLACLTTLCSLVSLSVDFIKDHCKMQNLGYGTILLIVMLVSYLISFFRFNMLAKYLAQALAMIYPAMIAFALLKLIQKKLHIHKYIIVVSFWVMVLISVII